MRVKIGQSGVGGNNESWYYLEFAEEEAKFYHVHEWNNMSFSLSVNEGEERTPLEQSKGKRFYEEAIKAIKIGIFSGVS
ncbi:hypothetical protein [Chitinimonas taiwanensis]|uniref:Uncharacterized protein n=1 Tax=Chitinimonas taiwanensis DSM 18899 TaxID=1121279 RepID=A0A1K2HMW8_9NEIS|nr:hypothetical protein [Chitinimonas taiwanensis]SFZ78148.1 hypothetical protein SAMN02745887_02819 [Chitinimonas taiwanensis DSM 18899]